MHCLALSRQIGHYHDARFRAASGRFERFTVLSCAGEGHFAEFAARRTDGYEVEGLAPDRAAYAAAVHSGAFLAQVLAVLDRRRPDAVAVSGWASAESFGALIWARQNRVPVVVMAESQADDARRSRLREALKGHIVRSFDSALAGGYSTRSYLAGLGMGEDRITLGYNAVDNAHFSAGADGARAEDICLRARHGLPPRYFLASSRFVPKKNLPRLVRAYARARAGTDAPFPDLVILGDGPERAMLETLICRAGLAGAVHLPGFREYDLLPVYYGLSAGFLHVATREQWGLVINEALAAGVPVLASDRCGATRTLLAGGRGGLVVDAADEAAIARAIAELAALSPEGWARMSAEARAAVANWGPDRFADGLEQAVAAGVPPRGPLPLWDRLLLTRMARRVYAGVD